MVCCNAGIASYAPTLELEEQMWQEMIDINLTGVWKTIRAAVPPMVERGQGGSVIITSSVFGLFGFPNGASYEKRQARCGRAHADPDPGIQLCNMIRVNSVHPTAVNTPMIMNDAMFRLFRQPGTAD